MNYLRTHSHKPNASRFSVTDLINPPLQRTLKIEKWNDIVVDVSDYLWMLLGSGVDTILSDTNVKDTITQRRMEEMLDGHLIVGVADVVNDTRIEDYKATSVYSFLLGDKPEWTAQLNSYSWLLLTERKRKNISTPITQLRIQAILRDWKYSDKFKKDYPPIAFQVVDIDLWPFEKSEDYLWSRLQDHLNNPKRECTSEEKWQTDTTYAVKNPAVKKAYRVLPTELEAQKWIENSGKTGLYIEKRIGEAKKCMHYCAVRSTCPYARN